MSYVHIIKKRFIFRQMAEDAAACGQHIQLSTHTQAKKINLTKYHNPYTNVYTEAFKWTVTVLQSVNRHFNLWNKYQSVYKTSVLLVDVDISKHDSMINPLLENILLSLCLTQIMTNNSGITWDTHRVPFIHKTCALKGRKATFGATERSLHEAHDSVLVKENLPRLLHA